jgi:hypothetical protein
MVKIEAVLHPEEAELVWTMLNRAATKLTREQCSPAIDDSAESGVAAQAPGIAATPLFSDGPACGRDDSAESRNGREPEALNLLRYPVMSKSTITTIPRNRGTNREE